MTGQMYLNKELRQRDYSVSEFPYIVIHGNQ